MAAGLSDDDPYDWYDPTNTYECAFCGGSIEHTGYDPCEVTVQAAREGATPGTWLFWAHATCVPAAFSPSLRADVGYAYETPPTE